MLTKQLKAGLGFVEIKDPSSYDGLPTPLYNFPNRTVYTTSMTHQLHCLVRLPPPPSHLSTR